MRILSRSFLTFLAEKRGDSPANRLEKQFKSQVTRASVMTQAQWRQGFQAIKAQSRAPCLQSKPAQGSCHQRLDLDRMPARDDKQCGVPQGDKSGRFRNTCSDLPKDRWRKKKKEGRALCARYYATRASYKVNSTCVSCTNSTAQRSDEIHHLPSAARELLLDDCASWKSTGIQIVSGCERQRDAMGSRNCHRPKHDRKKRLMRALSKCANESWTNAHHEASKEKKHILAGLSKLTVWKKRVA